MIWHHHGRRIFEAFDKQTNFVVDRRADRPAYLRHSTRAEKILGSREERVRCLLIVDRIEKPDEAGLVLIDLVVKMVDDRTNAANCSSLFVFSGPERERRVL